MESWEIESELASRYCDWQAARHALVVAGRSSRDRARLGEDEATARDSYLELRARMVLEAAGG